MEIIEILFIIGRLLFGGYFIHAGYSHFRNLGMMSGYAGSKGVPAPKAAIIGTGALLFLGGLSVLLGLYPLVGLAFLAVFLIGVTPKIHDFWNIEDPMQRMGERVNFLKNIGLLGAVLMLTVIERPWPYALGF